MTTPHVPYRFELELTVPATLAQVWQAVATAEGISAWMAPTELDGRVGGALTFQMGEDVTLHGRVTAFEPERRIAYEEDWAVLTGNEGADVTPLVTEFLVEARSGGTCVVRVVTSAYGTGAAWESEFWGEMDTGWAPMLDNLRLHLTYFGDRRAKTFDLDGSLPGAAESAMDALCDALGAGGVGSSGTLCGRPVVVERRLPMHMALRGLPPAECLVSISTWPAAEGSLVLARGSCYGDDAAAMADQLRSGVGALLAQVAGAATARS